MELDDVENADAYARLFSKSNSSANQRHSIHVDPSGSSRQLATRHLESTHNSLLSVTSPLKRNDVSMDVDRTASSPLPKRRSLHGASGQGSDISVEPLDISRYLQTQSYEILDEASAKKDQDAEKTADALAAPAVFAPPTRKASSLRRSALQLSLDSQSPLSKGSDSPRGSSRPETISRNSRPRPRVSDSHFIEPLPRGSPFPSPANLPPASLHQMPSDRPSRSDHPLSRTLTQSSSGSSLPDSPTHFPVHNPNPKPKPLLFSRSVPYGAARPRKEDVMPSSQGTETPDVKNDKPWAGAFYTAGLVSKMADMDKLDQYPVMPDTPCKKSFATYPADKILLRGKQIRHPFPMLTTPFHPAPTPSQETFGNGSRTIDIFNRPPTIGPKAAGSEGLEDDIGSGLSAFETFPPTPTRQTSLPPGGPEIDAGESPSSFRKSTLSLSAVGNGHDQGLSRSSCKSSPDEAPECRRRGGDPESPQMLDPCAKSASSVSSSSPPFSLPSFGRSRARRGPLYAPSPLKTAALKSIATASKKFSIAKASLVVPASPLESPVITTPSPHGPMMPPSTTKRPSLWSQNGAMPLALNLQRKTSFPPATPTSTRQNNPFSFKDRNVTPIGPRRDLDVDEFLAQRFRRVEKIGQGEFSTVFKVEGKSSSPSFSRSTSSALHNSSSPTPMAARDALAVKRVKKQRSSARYKEVDILRALRGRPHIIEFVDCWESEEHLYIVTEYCEESSLMLFLLPICKDSRLDDFRIWKILLEIGLVSFIIIDRLRCRLVSRSIDTSETGSQRDPRCGIPSSGPQAGKYSHHL